MKGNRFSAYWRRFACAAGMALATLATTGCQVDAGGQTLPSPYFLTDDVQYFAPGSEFKLQKEATALKAYRNEQQLQALQ